MLYPRIPGRAPPVMNNYQVLITMNMNRFVPSAITPSDQKEVARFLKSFREIAPPDSLLFSEEENLVLETYWLQQIAPIWDRFTFLDPQEAERIRIQLAKELWVFLPPVKWDESFGAYVGKVGQWKRNLREGWLQILHQELPRAGYRPETSLELCSIAELWEHHLFPRLKHTHSKPSSLRGKRRHRAQKQMRRLFRSLSQVETSSARIKVLRFLKEAGSAYSPEIRWRLFSPAQLAGCIRLIAQAGSPVLGEKQTYRPDQWVRLFAIHDFQMVGKKAIASSDKLAAEAWILAHFCHYQAPHWLLQRFMEGARDFEDWFVWLAKGNDFRTAPGTNAYPLTKRMTSFLWELEEAYLSPHQTLTYLLIRGWGGSQGVALDLVWGIRNRVCQPELLKWVVKHEQTWFPREAAVVYAYLEFQKGEAQHQRHEFSLKGRTPHSIRRQIDAFMQDREGYDRARAKGITFPLRWPASPLPGFTWNQFEICELTSQAELEAEGQALKHCVGGYAHLCAAGQSQIWSLKEQTKAGPEPLITIQVSQAQTIVQARGERNRLPTQEEGRIILKWAKQVGLKMGDRTWY